MQTSVESKKIVKEVIRCGDYVRIIEPQVFVRCGYPMWLPEVKKDLLDNRYKEVEMFVRHFLKEDESYLIKRTLEKDDLEAQTINGKKHVSKPMREIIGALAYLTMARKHFGGNERKIFTEVKENYRGKIFRVNSKKAVVTGKYCSGSESYDYYSGGYDYEPPILADSETHVILSLANIREKEVAIIEDKLYDEYSGMWRAEQNVGDCGSNCGGAWMMAFDDFCRIEKKHVQKLSLTKEQKEELEKLTGRKV